MALLSSLINIGPFISFHNIGVNRHGDHQTLTEMNHHVQAHEYSISGDSEKM